MNTPSKHDGHKKAAVQSMTGFANASVQTRAGDLNLDLRSVNSRFLDLHFRMPDELRSIEPLIREALTARFQRGKIEIRMQWAKNAQEVSLPVLREEGLQTLKGLEKAVNAHFPDAPGFRIADILAWPGVVQDNALTQEELRQTAAELIDQACAQLTEARTREGGQLTQILLGKVQEMKAELASLEPLLPQFLKAYEDKLTQRVNDSFSRALENVSTTVTAQEVAERIRHEVSQYSIRIDIAEEMERLKTHFVEIERILTKGGAVGKRLDFLMQELNREANTLGSKANAIEQTHASLNLKWLIEQMREQVQNLE